MSPEETAVCQAQLQELLNIMPTQATQATLILPLTLPLTEG